MRKHHPMPRRQRTRRPAARAIAAAAATVAVLALSAALLSACGKGSTAATATSAGAARAGTGAQAAQSPAAGSPRPTLLDWPEFGLVPGRFDATNAITGITAANVARLRRLRIALPGTVDSSAIYLHRATVAGAPHDVAVVTTTYGRTLAIDADSGRILWTFTPPDFDSWAGSSQVTTASPVADPDRRFVYAASPDGRVHKLALADGHEAGGTWPVSVTRDPTHEKLASALNVEGPDVLATTGGYFGDAPPYQGHLVLVDRASGRIGGVFNTLCSDRAGIIDPPTCPSSDSAVWARAGVVVEPSGRLLIATGNGPYNGSTDFGDSVLELDFPSLRLRQVYTPVNQAELNANDADLGSSAPALLSSDRAAIAGKDGVLRLLDLNHLDGADNPVGSHVLGGELRLLRAPGGDQVFTAPAVWRHGGQTTMFLADNSGTAAYALRGGQLQLLWENSTGGTSPVVAGGLLYVYDPSGGGVNVYPPGSSTPISTLACGSGHWNSPIVVDGRVIEPEGNYMDHAEQGTLNIFR
jgi:outer membrane protein assembly factor BamB